jgi:shikimate dehydrogenase
MPKAAVLGSPISHSKSPLLHAAAYRALDLAWTYERHEVDEASFPGFLQIHAGEFNGLSLTMPLKRVGFEVAEVRDSAAEATGAVNTLVFSDQLRGYNTDVVGFREALRVGGAPLEASATIIGTGATAQSAAYAMVLNGVTELHVVGRRADAVASMGAWLANLGVTMRGHRWDEPLPQTQVTIAAVVAGAADGLRPPRDPGLLCDAIYAPWPTGFASSWIGAGGTALSGIDLLVHQAAQQVLLMTHVHADNREAIVTAMYQALRAIEFGT